MNVLILTPDPADPSAAGRWPEAFERMAAPLRAAGATVEGRPWTAPGDLTGFARVLPLMAWGYYRQPDLWRRTVDGWAAAGVPVANPPAVLRWNADKAYLARLAEAGAPVVPTLAVERLDGDALDAARARFGTDTLVVKPTVSAGAFQTLRLRPGDPLDGTPAGAALIQPYLSAVEAEGELSLVFLGGRFSHALAKVAAPGDFRVQPEWGGRLRPVVPDAAALDAAAAVLATVAEPLLYARIDLVRDGEGRPRLMEAELIEPDLYLGLDPEAPARFARAVLAAPAAPAAS